MSLADQLARKSTSLKSVDVANAVDFASEDQPSPTPASTPAAAISRAPSVSGAGGGNVMSELANRLKKV